MPDESPIGWYWHEGRRLHWAFDPPEELIEWLATVQLDFAIYFLESQNTARTSTWAVWCFANPSDEFWCKMRWPIWKADFPYADDWWYDPGWWDEAEYDDPDALLVPARIGQWKFRKNAVSPMWCGPKKTKRVR